MHLQRTWNISSEQNLTPAELAEELRRFTWTLCSAFRCGNTIWLNDSTGADRLQEYAVVRESDLQQIETITVSWCTSDQIIALATDLSTSLIDSAFMHSEVRAEQLQPNHQTCPHCA